jgi:hypothetical protein
MNMHGPVNIKFINTVSNEEVATYVDEQEGDLYTGLVTNSCLSFSR